MRKFLFSDMGEKHWISGLWLLFLGVSLIGQPIRMPFETFTIEDGLSQSTVRCMLQDRHGYLWFGTEDGLNRFDGYEIRVFRRSGTDPRSLVDNWINCLLEDTEGRIWIGTQAGLSVFLPAKEEFVSFRQRDSVGLKRDNFTAVRQAPDGQIWCIANYGLHRVILAEKPSDWRFEVVNIPFAWKQQKRNTGSLYDLHIDPDNRLWLAAYGNPRDTLVGGLICYDPISGSMQRIQPHADFKIDHQVHRLMPEANGKLWVGMFRQGLNLLKEKAGKLEMTNWQQAEGLPHPQVRAMLRDRKGRLWIGTYDGLAIMDKNGKLRPVFPMVGAEGFGTIEVILEDRSGNIWLGTGGNCFRLSGHKKAFGHEFADPDNHQSLLNDDILGLLVRDNGEVWSSNYEAGVSRVLPAYNGKRKYIHYTPENTGQPISQVLGIREDKAGRIWLITLGNGLFEVKLDPDDPLATPSMISHPVKTPSYVYDWLEDSLGRQWVIHYTEGLFIREKRSGQWKQQQFRPGRVDSFGLPPHFHQHVYRDHAGHIWLSNNVGLVRAYEQANRQIAFRRLVLSQEDARIRDPKPTSFYRTKDGLIWLGTSSGLIRIELEDEEISPWAQESRANLPFRFRQYKREDGLPSNFIYAIEADDQGRLWLSTSNGLSRFDPKTESFRNFTPADGLQSKEFNGNSSAKSSDGKLYFGGIHGYNDFHPDSILDNPAQPEVHITGISLYNQRLRPGQKIPQSDYILDRSIDLRTKITLSWQDDVIGFSFSSMDFSFSDQVQYAYRLVGEDEDWIPNGTRNFLTYTNLSPGTHILEIKASNSDGIWSPHIRRLQIEISTPPWQSWWAMILYGLLLSMIVYLLVRARTRAVRQELKTQMRIQQAKTEERELVRAQSSRDFHDEAGNKLTKISLYAGLTRQLGKEQPQMLEYLEHIEQNVRELSSGMRDFIWVLDPTRDSLPDTLLRIRDFGEQLFAHSGIDFVYQNHIPDRPISIDIQTKRHLLLIFKEAMHNALKYANCQAVRLSSQLDNGQLRIEVIDDGLGFSKEKLDRINGLNNMKSRAAESGGTLSIHSLPGQGTRIVYKKEIHPNG
ncbi:MAG: two-component regulator propeller domain-containing protein [Bacteroidota bacterium]